MTWLERKLEQAQKKLEEMGEYFSRIKHKSRRERLQNPKEFMQGLYYTFLLFYYAVVYLPLCLLLLVYEYIRERQR
jgi:hypothetical protein